MLVKTINQDEVTQLREVFEHMDKDGTGMINAQELSEYLISKQSGLTDKEVQSMINEIDYQGNGKINYSEFLAATIDVKRFLTDPRLHAIF